MNRYSFSRQTIFLILLSCLAGVPAGAQEAQISSRTDAGKISVGDRAKLYIEIRHNAAQSRIEWAAIPDTFNHLEIVQKGKIDTSREEDMVSYKQQLQITGFDSGVFVIPAFSFRVIPGQGDPYTIISDSFGLLVQTMPVDTSKGYKGIKEIIYVKASWTDYIWWIAGGALLALALTAGIIYLVRKKKAPAPEPPVPSRPPESLQQRYLRLLRELEGQQLWQQNRVKEYYVALTDILRDYIEERFHTPAMELTTDEVLDKARSHKEMRIHLYLLEQILHTADLAKFARAQPLPHEHDAALEATRKFVTATTQVIPDPTQQNP